MASQSKIIVELGADVSGLKKGFDDAVKSIHGLGNAVRGFQARAGAFGFDKLVEAASAVPGALAEATSRVLEMGGKLADLSTSTGMGVVALQKLEDAGSLVGVSLETSLGAFRKMGQNIVSGSKQTSEALTQLHLSGSALRSMGADEALAKVGEKLRTLPTDADKAAAGTAIFGKSWASVAPLVLGGMTQVEDQARKLGVSYAALTGQMSEQTVAAADALGDNLDLMGKSWTGLLNNFGNAVVSSQAVHDAVDGVTKIIASLSQGLMDNKDAFQSAIETGLWIFLEVLAGGGAIITGFLTVLKLMVEGLTIVTAAALNGASAVTRFLAVAASKIGKDELAASLNAQADSFDVMSSKAQDLGSKVDAALTTARDTAASATVAVHDLANGLGTGNAKLADTADKGKQAGDALRFTSEAAKQAADVLAAFNDKLAAGRAKDAGPLASAMAGIDQDVDNSIQKLQALADTGQLDAVVFGHMRAAIMLAGGELRKFAAEEVRISRFGKTASDASKELAIMGAEAAKLGVNVQRLATSDLDALLSKMEALVIAGGEDAAALRMLADAASESNDRHAGKQKDDAHQASIDNLNALAAAEQAYYDAMFAANAKAVADVRALAESFTVVGNAIGGVAGTLMNFAGGALQILANLSDDNLQYASTWQKVGMAAQAAANIIAQSKEERSGGKRAASGAMQGAQAGAAFGPYGMIIGAVAGALIGLFSGPKWAETAHVAGQTFGFEVSNELAKAIYATKLKLNVDDKSAALLHINDAMAEGKKNASEMTTQMSQLLAGIANHSIPAQEGIKELGTAFASLSSEVMSTSNVGSAAMVNLIRQAREAGVKVAEISAFVSDQLTKAQGGVSKMVASFSEDKGEGGSFISGIQINDTKQAADQGTIFAAVFWASVKEHGIVQASDAMREPFQRLYESISMVGTTALSDQVLGPMQRIMALTAEGGLFRGAAEGAEGLRAALDGLSASGYLTRDSFAAIQSQAGAAFDQMIAGGATTNDALLAMGPTLQDIVAASQQYGFELDSNTARLVQQAKDAGVAFPVDPMMQMVDILRSIATVLGAEIPASAQQSTQALDAMGEAANATTDQMAADVSTAMDTMVAEVNTSLDQAASSVDGSFAAMADAGDGSMNSLLDSVSNTFAEMVGEGESGAADLTAAVEGLAGLHVTIPVTYVKTNGPPGGGGGGGPLNYDGTPDYDGDPTNSYKKGIDAVLASDQVFKAHRGERLSIIPNGGSSPMSREIAQDVADALGRAGVGGGGNAQAVRQPITLEIGGRQFARLLFEMTKTGDIRIHESAIVDN